MAQSLCALIIVKYRCGEKYEPGHQEVCPKHQKPQINAFVANGLDNNKEKIPDDMLNQLVVEDALSANFYQLSINALTSTDTENSIKLKSMVKNKVMLILLDSGSSHSFVSKDFLELTKLETVPIQPRKVKLANGEYLTALAKVQNLEWYIQGHTLSSDMIVLDMAP